MKTSSDFARAAERVRAVDTAGVDQIRRATEFTLSDAMRHGASHTDADTDWGDGESACALSAAAISAASVGYVDL